MQLFYKIVTPLFITLLFCVNGFAQVIEPVAVYNKIDQSKYFRFHYDNDFFTKNRDHYYTQGITLEYVNPGLKNNPINKLLIKGKGSSMKYGVSLDYFGYTPTDILSADILYGDRPYASAFTIKSFVTTTNSKNNEVLSSAFLIGIIGPATLGKEVQTLIHRTIQNNRIPRGWQYQVKNDVIINYQVYVEKELLSFKNIQLNALAEGRAGTLNNKLSAGLSAMAGKSKNIFDKEEPASSKKFQAYVFGQSYASLIGYDASLQGGMFNRNSPYTIASGDINRITLRTITGFAVNYKKLSFIYSKSFLTKEFNTGRTHKWGGFSLGIGL